MKQPLKCAVSLLAAHILLLLQPGPAQGSTRVTLIPTADTYVDSGSRGVAFGKRTSLAVDSSSAKQIFLRFQVGDLSRLKVTGVLLRMYCINGSTEGGRIWTLSEQPWNEKTTWNSRPAIDGGQIGAFGSVNSGRWHEIALPTSLLKQGALSLAMDSPVTDLARWASREVRVAPQLVIDGDIIPKSNAAPVAVDDHYVLAADTPLVVTPPGVLANDSDADEDPLSAVLASSPQHGTLTLNSNGGFTYTPNSGFLGSDKFTYRASDGTANSNLADVALTVTVDRFDTFEFTPEIDTYIDASRADTSFAAASGLWVDNSPRRTALFKFNPDSLAGRKILGTRLRLYQTDNSPVGSDVVAMDDTTWAESVTWNTRPSISGPVLESFGPVSSGNWYEIALGANAVDGDGRVSFAIESPSSDGVKWASREHTRMPRLLVDVKKTGATLTGLSRVAYNYVGSSDPTYFASQHRLALTSGGRQIALHGRHTEGVQMAWRDPGGGWQTASHGALQDGLLIDGTGTGDWTASVIVADDSNGEENAWVVYSGDKPSSTFPVRMRRLSDVDSPAGPWIGPESIVSSKGLGNSSADLNVETGPDGAVRGIRFAWVERRNSTNWDVRTAHVEDLLSETPDVSDFETIVSGLSNGSLSPTLVRVSRGIALVAVNAAGELKSFRYDPTNETWDASPAAPSTSGRYPSAVALSDDTIFAAAYSGTTVRVFRFSADNDTVTSELTLSGFREPALATDGARIWLVMVRSSDGDLVSRERGADGTWRSLKLESAADGSNVSFRWPNTLRTVTDGYVRVLVEGPDLGAVRSTVLAFQRIW